MLGNKFILFKSSVPYHWYNLVKKKSDSKSLWEKRI